MQSQTTLGDNREERSTRAKKSVRQQSDVAAGIGQNLAPSGRSAVGAPGGLLAAAALSNQSKYASSNNMKSAKDQARDDKKQGRWTAQEKEKFVEALKLYGKDWKKVESHIKTRSGAQIRSHAQKFFLNVEKTKGMDIDQYIALIQEQGGMVTPVMSVTGNVSQMPNQEQSFQLEGSSNMDQKGENRSLGSISQAGQSGISDVSHSKQLYANQTANMLNQFQRSKPQTSVKKSESHTAEQFNATQFDPNHMMRQNSAVKGAMSLLSQAHMMGGNKQKLRLSPTKFKNPSTGLSQQMHAFALAMAQAQSQNFESQIRAFAPEKVDLDDECWLMLDQLTLAPLRLNFSEIWGLSQNSRVAYKTLQTPFEGSGEAALPEQLNELQMEINNYGFGAYNQVLLHKFQNGIWHKDLHPTHLENPGSQEMPTIVLAIAENRSRREQQQQFTQIVNLETNQLVKQIPVADGTMISFSGNFQDKYKFEVQKPVNANVNQRLMILTYSQTSAEAANHFKSSPSRHLGKTPSFGGIGLSQYAQGNMFGLSLNPQEKSMILQQNQVSNMNLSSLAANFFTGQHNLNKGIRNMGIGPQGRDRACSTQSGFMTGPTLKQQAEEQKKSKLLISKISDMLKKKQLLKDENQQIPPSKTYDDTPQSVNNNNMTHFAKALMAQSKPPELGVSKSFNARTEQHNPGLMNMLKPLMEKQSQRSHSQIQSRNSPQVQYPPTQTNEQIKNLVKQFYNKKQEKETKKEGNGNQLLANITNLLKSMKKEPKPQAAERSQTVSPEQVLQAMLQAKGPSFPARGISEISRQSQMSKQQDFGGVSRLGLTSSKQIGNVTAPFSRMPTVLGQSQRNSGEDANTNSIGNQKVRGLPLQPKFSSHRPSGGSNPSSNPAPSINQIEPGQSIHQETLHQPSQMAYPAEQKYFNNKHSLQEQETYTMPQKTYRSPIHATEPENSHQMDNKFEIQNLERRKHTLYLNFISDLTSHILFINEAESEEFVQKYIDQFSDIQGKFLNLFNQEMTFYAHHQQDDTKAIKELIDKEIVRNMIEVINVQILLKLISHLFCQNRAADGQQGISKRFKEMSPIDLGIFQRLIPDSYAQDLQPLQVKSYQGTDNQNQIIQDQCKQIVVEDVCSEHSEVEHSEKEEAVPDRQNGGSVAPDDHYDQRMSFVHSMLNNPANSGALGTVNLINKSTFSQIAHSLSPEPERLLQQQIGVPLDELTRTLLGQKRALIETSIRATEQASAQKRQRTNQEETDEADHEDNEQREPPHQSDHSSQQSEDNAASDLNKANVDDVIQGLLMQYQESQRSSNHKPARTRMSQAASLIAEGVRAGGYRQTAYSESHQELALSVQRLSAHDIQLISSARKSQVYDAYKAQLRPQNMEETDLLNPPIIQLQQIKIENLQDDNKQTNNTKPIESPITNQSPNKQNITNNMESLSKNQDLLLYDSESQSHPKDEQEKSPRSHASSQGMVVHLKQSTATSPPK